MCRCEQQPPLKVVRAFRLSDGAALVHLHNMSGGVLGGDKLKMQVEAGPGTRVQLTSTGATRVYRSLGETAVAEQVNEITVGEGALMEYLPDALIPFRDARYRQETRILLADGAGLFWWETIAPGREAHGEVFGYKLLQLKVDISSVGVPLFQEFVNVQPSKGELSSFIRLGHYRYFSSFYICRVGLGMNSWLKLESELSDLAGELAKPDELICGISTLPAHGLVIRALGRKLSAISSGLMAFWVTAKERLYGRSAVAPRKMA